jgi:hypothetical protein
MNANDLKKLATQVRRTETVLRQLRAQTKTSEFARHWDRAIQESMLPK